MYSLCNMKKCSFGVAKTQVVAVTREGKRGMAMLCTADSVPVEDFVRQMDTVGGTHLLSLPCRESCKYILLASHWTFFDDALR